jgi:hypothetical protein
MAATIVSLIPDEQSQRSLVGYLAKISPKINFRRRFHSTVYYAEETPLFQEQELRRRIAEMLPITIDPRTYYFDTFGENHLVLGYENTQVCAINLMLLQEAVRQMICLWPTLDNKILRVLGASNIRRQTPVFTDYNPHITLTNDYTSDSLNLKEFQTPITFNEVRFEL